MAPDLTDNRQTYLNDHLAGAEGALELLEDIEKSDDAEMAALARRLRSEITAEREQLEQVMERLGASRERAKQMLASLAESASRLKLARAGPPPVFPRLLEFESLSAGIWMKKRLWRSLAFAEALGDALDGIELEDLQARADTQLELVEEHRLALAARIL